MHIILFLCSIVITVGTAFIVLNQVSKIWREWRQTSRLRTRHQRSGASPRPSQRTNTPQENGEDEDPRLAAAVMLCATAQSCGVISSKEQAVILEQMRNTFDEDNKTVRDLFAHGRALAITYDDLELTYSSQANVIMANCDSREREEVIYMLSTVAEVHGSPSSQQSAAIDRLRRRFGVS